MHDAADCVRPIDGRSAVRYDLDALERAERNERHVGEIPEAARCQAPAVEQYQRGFRTKATEIDAGTVGNVVLAPVACRNNGTGRFRTDAGEVLGPRPQHMMTSTGPGTSKERRVRKE